MFITGTRAWLSTRVSGLGQLHAPSECSGVDPYVTTMQWSRRFLGLRLFLSLAPPDGPAMAITWSARSG